MENGVRGSRGTWGKSPGLGFHLDASAGARAPGLLSAPTTAGWLPS